MPKDFKPLFMYQVHLLRTKYEQILNEGAFIALNGGYTKFNYETQQFLCLKNGCYFVDTMTLVDNIIYFDCKSRMYQLHELDACWQIVEQTQ